MAQEENALRYSSCTDTEGGGGGGGGGGGIFGTDGLSSISSRSKKIKQKKVPQRGLGVAQLERIRLEEQQKREALQTANILANNAVISDLVAVQCPNLRPNLNISPNSIPSPNMLFRPTSSIPTIEIINQGSVQISKHVANGSGEIEILSPRNGNLSRFYNLDGGKQSFDHNGFVFRCHGQVDLLYEGNLPQRSHHSQQQASSSSMVNASCLISPSSVLSSQMEPPSNQIFHGNSYRQSWTEEDKMVGTKRSYLFSRETPPPSSFHENIRPTFAVSKSRSDELAVSCSNEHTSPIEPQKQYIREGPSNLSSLSDRNLSEVLRDDTKLCGDFLTLAPPNSNSKHKNLLDSSGLQGRLVLDSDHLFSKENSRGQMQWQGSRASSEHTFSFFPIKSEDENSSIHVSNGKGGRGETIDLNLKL